MFRLTGIWLLSALLSIFLACSACAQYCPTGDLDGNCKVDWQDILCFSQQWLDAPGCWGADCADLVNSDGVNWADFSVLADNWLTAKEYLVINEFLASNSSTPPLENGELLDGNGEASDWIELYNPTDKTVVLDGWHLTDDEDDLVQWQFPAGIAVEPNDYLVVFASGKTYQDYYPGNYPYLDPNGYYHTNFKISIDGEYLAIVKPDGTTVVDSISFGPQSADVSYGRYPDGNDSWLPMPVPSPGQENNWGYLGIVADTKFSHNRGFYDSAFDTVITCETEGAVIHYTTDGNEPTESSPVYTGAIHISQTTCLRARAFKPDWKPSNVDTHSYFFGVSAVRKSLPVISIVGNGQESLYEPNGIMAIVGGEYIWIVSYPVSWVPKDPNDPNEYNNPIQRGMEYERPVSIELIYPADNSGFQIDCGIRVQGSDWHRQRYKRANNADNSEDWLGGPYNMEKFSFMLNFRNIYGQNRLEYPLFPLFPVDRFQSIVIRGGYNDCYNPFLKDELYRRLHKDMGYVAGSGMMANIFINGHYKAYFNSCERIDTDFLQEWYNSDKEWDVITQFEPDKSVNGEVREGDMVAWNAVHDYMVSHDLTNNVHYQYVAAKLDIPAFIDYLILELYAANWDWPRNNWTVAAERSDTGIFRFYMWDTEMSMEATHLYSSQFGSLNIDDYPLCRIYRALKPNSDFRQMFADRVHKHFYNNSALVESSITKRFVELQNELSAVIPSMDTYTLTTWIPQRRAIILNIFASQLGFSGLAAPIFNINGSYQHGGYVSDSDAVTIVNPNGGGIVYYTIDNSDPRAGGGGISGSAIVYNGTPFALTASTHLKARVWD
ncbi:MAG TPA: chitobiase/beta-hexosaminidase C-terminal domain-containing protein, partial [Sedimentisphaerales bacterium]|nr:chitobiase/beta-hexosaminidase C-terminal domain-containing protein [Sedimentisphaerales bacterium]